MTYFHFLLPITRLQPLPVFVCDGVKAFLLVYGNEWNDVGWRRVYWRRLGLFVGRHIVGIVAATVATAKTVVITNHKIICFT